MNDETTSNSPVEQPRLVRCLCGCGSLLKSGKFANGHFSRDPARRAEWIAKLKNTMGKDETRAKVSAGLRKKWSSGTWKMSEEGRIAKSKAMKEYCSCRDMNPHHSPETFAAIGKKVSEIMLAKGESHDLAKAWQIRSPENITYRFRNLMKFVRDNPSLFDASDTIWRRSKQGAMRCPAIGGLCSISPRKKQPNGSWKGWTWVSITERAFNAGNDLLDRPILPPNVLLSDP